MHKSNTYDYIFTGGGCAALSLLMHITSKPTLSKLRILVLDVDQKETNDRTWSWWEETPNLFSHLAIKSWDKFELGYHNNYCTFTINPFTYKTIIATDFYKYCKKVLSTHSIDWKQEKVLQMKNDGTITTDLNTYKAKIVFNSIINKDAWGNSLVLWQHFYGEFIETKTPCFNPQQATWMDFNVPQQNGATFMYILPFSETKALVEYTVFSSTILDKEIYKQEVTSYLSNQKIDAYDVYNTEFDKIPMTSYKFPRQNGCIINIGTNGGATRASTGFTFNNIQKQAKHLSNLLQKNPFSINYGYSVKEQLHHKLDVTLLNILATQKLTGEDIFGNLFDKNEPQKLLKFLNGTTNLKETLAIMQSTQIAVFAKAFLFK